MVSAVLSRFCSTAINSWHADAQRAARVNGGRKIDPPFFSSTRGLVFFRRRRHGPDIGGGNGRIDAGPAVLITLSR